MEALFMDVTSTVIGKIVFSFMCGLLIMQVIKHLESISRRHSITAVHAAK